MIFRKFLFSLIILAFTYNSYSQNIDSKNSKVSFTLKSMGLKTVKGDFTGMEGELIFYPNDSSKSNFEVCVDANSINTGITKRDNHLKNEDFFDVAKYPKICFLSTKIVKTESGYKTTGTLSMHGVSKTIEIPFTYKDKQLIGDFKVKRLEYKIGEGTGGFMIGKEVSIEIVCMLE